MCVTSAILLCWLMLKNSTTVLFACCKVPVKICCWGNVWFMLGCIVFNREYVVHCLRFVFQMVCIVRLYKLLCITVTRRSCSSVTFCCWTLSLCLVSSAIFAVFSAVQHFSIVTCMMMVVVVVMMMLLVMMTVMILRYVLMQVGQMQLLRRQIAHQLHTSCKFNSKFLASALNTMNEYGCVHMQT